ncbi:F-box only protein 9 [Stylophora pistillata]|uniref:F-box only protein 9 n=1 Tax=Stylophora pistillata TaxID=50429 RepID=A0A2B4RKD7_STYPI|nr:F-box only protein 9 [Stylophora pistillata]
MVALLIYYTKDEGGLEEELASFRLQWKEEIQRSTTDSGSSRNSPVSESASRQSREGSPSPLVVGQKKVASSSQPLQQPQQLEEKAANLFLQGVSAERNGDLYEAIYFYRQAVQLVPDIEFRIKDFTNLASDLANRFHSLSVTGFCQPLYETRGLGCKLWYSSAVEWLLETHVYQTSTSSVCWEGEKNLDLCYRPYHVVQYYRYMRFYVDGTVLIYTSADEPVTAIARLKLKHGNSSSVSVGHYRLSGDKVIIIINKKVTSDSYNQTRGRRMRLPPPPILKQVFHMEFQINSVGRRHHNQLTWLHYSVNTTYSQVLRVVERCTTLQEIKG